jgi:hypothetical protein
MSLTSRPDITQPPADPKGPDIHPLVVLALAVSLAVGAGVVAGWPAGVSVLLAVVGLFARHRNGSAE